MTERESANDVKLFTLAFAQRTDISEITVCCRSGIERIRKREKEEVCEELVVVVAEQLQEKEKIVERPKMDRLRVFRFIL